MPYTPKRPCRYPGCPNLCESGVYCEAHRKEWSHEALRGGAAARGYHMANPAVSPVVSSTVGLKNMVIAPLTADTEGMLTYGELQLVAGAIEASITPQNADPDVQYFDDVRSVA